MLYVDQTVADVMTQLTKYRAKYNALDTDRVLATASQYEAHIDFDAICGTRIHLGDLETMHTNDSNITGC